MKRQMRRQNQRRYHRSTQQAADARRSPETLADRRGGSTLMIVIALLAMLSLVGVVFYTFAAQERSNAEYWAQAAKVRPCGIPASAYFDLGLRQLIVGPDKNEVQSVLWGGRHSLVINMLGYEPGQFVPTNLDELTNDSRSSAPFSPEAHPFTGRGIHLMMDGTSGNVSVDQDYDGTTDSLVDANSNGIHDYLEVNLSPSAHRGVIGNPLDLPQPDVDYTAADNNSMFAAYDGYGINGSGSPTRTIIPSFLRPWLVRDMANDWWANVNTVTRTLRPHQEHEDAVALLRDIQNGTSPLPSHYLYVRSGDSDISDFNGPFPFAPDHDGDTRILEIGAYDSAHDKTDLDVDNDQDGIREGIWMYLGSPLVQCPDGSSYVALHSFTVVDLDALLNINVHGNSTAINDNLSIDGNPFGGNQFLSRSNAGIGPGEVNLQQGLYTDPGSAGASDMLPYDTFFGRTAATRLEMSNQDFFFLTRGRPEFSGSGDTRDDVVDLIPGRYGEEGTALYNSIRMNPGAAMDAWPFPQAGTTGSNDQGNTLDPILDSPRFGHPLAYNGAGSYTSSSGYRYPDLVQPFGSGNPNVWLRYFQYNCRTNAPTNRSTLPLWGDASTVGGVLMDSTTGDANVDDAEEIIVDRKYLQSSDDVFSAEETAMLHASQTALDTVGLAPRLEDLLPYTMGTHVDRRITGKRFTSVSADRKTFGIARTGSRTWEFTSNEFPPVFGAAAAYGNRDPFRYPLRQILETEDGRLPSAGLRQFRLNINRLLYRNSTSGAVAYRPLTAHPNNPGTSTIPGLGASPAEPPNITTTAQQEAWARYDRQRMARDIYVLLYTLGGGNDDRDYTAANTDAGPDTANDPTTTLGLRLRNLYDDVQLREMAQFAVNLVDSLDRDNIITKFEYDKNLGSDGTAAGWNLDDNAFDSTDSDLTLAADRGVVYGVEAQQLTFSEALALWAEKDDSSGTATDHSVTQWNDTEDVYFTHLELRNAAPYSVNFDNGGAGTSDDGAWQVEVEVASTGAPIPSRRYLTIKSGTVGSISAGGLLTIKSIGGQGIATAGDRFQDPITASDLPANIVIDHDYIDGTTPTPVYDYRISPAGSSGSELDLIFPVTGRTSRYTLTDSEVTGGTSFVSLLDHTNLPATPDGGTIITFRLRRRLHPVRATPTNPTSAYNDDNPWVVVDEKVISYQQGFEQLTPDGSDIHGADFVAAPGANFNDVRSREREQPLDRTRIADHNSGSVVFRRNTIRANNSLGPGGTPTGTAFTLWQSQFDRDFASIGELLSIPLYGPGDVTLRLPRNSLNPRINTARGTYLAAANFLQPQAPINTVLPYPAVTTAPVSGEADLDNDNRWYRLFEFVEVPTRTHLQIPSLDSQINDELDVTLVPGKINPNMLRHPEVLAALLDDARIAGDGSAYMLSTTYMNNPNGTATHMPDRIEGNNRDWWEQFLFARDRLDPLTNLYLPGLPGSRPFHSYSYSPPVNGTAGNAYTVDGLESTLLRGLSTGNSRRLFEVGTSTDFNNGADTNRYRNATLSNRPIQTPIRHQLLSKIAGNITTRSHAFVVFMSIGFFEAKVSTTGSLRIGGRLNGVDSDFADHRGVFVVNRALIDDAYNASTGRIDWNKLVEYRLTVK